MALNHDDFDVESNDQLTNVGKNSSNDIGPYKSQQHYYTERLRDILGGAYKNTLQYTKYEDLKKNF